jgi:hypothetical protein
MLSYRDVWTPERGNRRYIEGCTLQIILNPADWQHGMAALQLHSYCGYFNEQGPIVIGRGCYNTWRPDGFANRGTRILFALEAYSLSMTKEAFTTKFAKQPNQREYLPGEVVVYGQGDLAVCIGNPKDDVAIPLKLFSASDPEMGGFPIHLSQQEISASEAGFNLAKPIWAVAVAVGEWFQNRNELATRPIDPTNYDYRRAYLRWRQAYLDEDLHDLLYLAFSQAKYNGVYVQANDANLATLRTYVEGYLRSFDQNHYTDEAMRETVTDYFIQIGFYARGTVMGPRQHMYGQRGW